MFYVHGVQGRLFQGPLEELRRVDAVRQVARARGAASTGADPDTHDPAGVSTPCRRAVVHEPPLDLWS